MGAVVKLSHDSGLTLVLVIEEISSNSGNDAEAENVTAYALYTMGPVSVGYQGYYLDNGTVQQVVQQQVLTTVVMLVGIAFNVNDQCINWIPKSI